MKTKLVVLTGAGISAESGIKTFRDSDGLWEGYDVMTVASIEGWNKNPALVLDFYNQRRKQLLTVNPNTAHFLLAELQDLYELSIITQNVDDLHERAGSLNVIHLHGELRKCRSVVDQQKLYSRDSDIVLGDLCESGFQLRPHIVWFGEDVPLMNRAIELTAEADVFLIIGSSLQVYPAAGLMYYLKNNTPIYYIDPNPVINYELKDHRQLHIIKASASLGMQLFQKELEKLKLL
ncbi:MAG: Sir2 family NAD-dependent protein deacetylase [Saprospiraceae bacterium]|nr:NAD-dependent deacylase [Saprospiraceae bacterium]